MTNAYCAKLCASICLLSVCDSSFAFTRSDLQLTVNLETRTPPSSKQWAVARESADLDEGLAGLNCRINLRDMHREHRTYQWKPMTNVAVNYQTVQ